jgi:hypothetical protein
MPPVVAWSGIFRMAIAAHLATTASMQRKPAFGQAAAAHLVRRNKYNPTATPLTTVWSPETKTFLVLVSPVTIWR